MINWCTHQCGYDVIKKSGGAETAYCMYNTFVKNRVLEAVCANVVHIHLNFGYTLACLYVGHKLSNIADTK
jgi:hypothetical protein